MAGLAGPPPPGRGAPKAGRGGGGGGGGGGPRRIGLRGLKAGGGGGGVGDLGRAIRTGGEGEAQRPAGGDELERRLALGPARQPPQVLARGILKVKVEAAGGNPDQAADIVVGGDGEGDEARLSRRHGAGRPRLAGREGAFLAGGAADGHEAGERRPQGGCDHGDEGGGASPAHHQLYFTAPVTERPSP